MAIGARMLLLGAAVAALGCDAGGLLVATSISDGDAGVQGPSVTDFVNAGNVAKNDKYVIVYTFGQATPNQGVSTSPNNTDNGGLVGAMNGH